VKSLRWFVFLTVCLLFPTLSIHAAEWPQWRGPDGQGHANAHDLPITFSETKNVAWRTEIPGRGWSSPVIDGNQIWLTTAIELPTSETEREQRLVGNTNNQPLNVADKISLRAVCVDRSSGKLLHDIEVLVVSNPDPIHSLNTYASPSPVLADGLLYCHFGTYGTACVDTKSHDVVWTNDELRIKHENGPGSTPIVWGDLFIVHCDGSDQQYIAALDRKTGDRVWRTDRSGTMDPDPQMKKAYGTPIVIDIDGKPTVVSQGADWLYGYDPATGSELWKVAYGVLGFSIVPRPVSGHGMIYMSTSFMQPEILAIRFQDNKPEIAWRFHRQAPQMPSPLLIGDELYMVSEKGIATCLNALTGEPYWSERLGGNFSSSPIFADGHIYVGNREGEMFVFDPGTTFQTVTKNQLDGQIMATPAAVDDQLIIRTDKALYCIRK